MENLTGKQLGPYQIVAPLGEGGMAAVFKAYHPSMDRYVALKVLPRHFSSNPEFIQRFSQEARLIAKLEHPHILPVHDFGESDGYTYLAMRLVEGGSLADFLKKRRKLDLALISRIVSQVGSALNYAHEKGIIHRDFKPGNILIDKFENCLLTDFGIAKLVEATSHLTHTGGILGTPAYISPEQGSGKPIDNRSDIYSLGVVLYQMVVGDLPYKADTPMAVIYKHIHDPLPLPRQRVPDLPESIERVILKALAKNPDDRYSTVADLVNALRNAIEQPVAEIQEVHEPILETEPVQVVKETPVDETESSSKQAGEPRPAIKVPARKFKIPLILFGLGILVVLGLFVDGTVFKKQKDLVSKPKEISSVTESNKQNLQSESVSSVTPKKKLLVMSKRPDVLPVADKKIKNSLGMEFVYIPPGTFIMGSPSSEPGRGSNEKQHRVTLTQGFYMQTTEVTQGQWTAVMGRNPSKFTNCGDNCPVETVSWNNAQNFIRMLNRKEGIGTYRLPTEAEWEYSARAGSTTAFANGNISELKCGHDSNLDAMGWYCGNSNKKTHPVAQKRPNDWGLYDMHGNVNEFVQDRYGKYPSDFVTDPKGPSNGPDRVMRGGCWFADAMDSRSAKRYGLSPDYRYSSNGFRLVLLPGP
jgi:serine/threonine protein kinase